MLINTPVTLNDLIIVLGIATSFLPFLRVYYTERAHPRIKIYIMKNFIKA